eukprot:PhM_4_TR2042/c0_g1_i3/m.95418
MRPYERIRNRPPPSEPLPSSSAHRPHGLAISSPDKTHKQKHISGISRRINPDGTTEPPTTFMASSTTTTNRRVKRNLAPLNEVSLLLTSGVKSSTTTTATAPSTTQSSMVVAVSPARAALSPKKKDELSTTLTPAVGFIRSHSGGQEEAEGITIEELSHGIAPPFVDESKKASFDEPDMPLTMTIHVPPEQRSTPTTDENVVLLCHPCDIVVIQKFARPGPGCHTLPLEYVVSCDDTSIFDEGTPPTIAPDGTLRFNVVDMMTVPPNTCAALTVYCRDLSVPTRPTSPMLAFGIEVTSSKMESTHLQLRAGLSSETSDDMSSTQMVRTLDNSTKLFGPSPRVVQEACRRTCEPGAENGISHSANIHAFRDQVKETAPDGRSFL